MGKLLKRATEQRQLDIAWRKIRENGISSDSLDTRIAVKDFDRNTNGNIRRLQRRLRKNEFVFDLQTGVLKKKSSGGFRGIVMASVNNRIVERALLNELQNNSEFVRSVNMQPTSVGGVPDRSVPHGLAIINKAIEEGYKYFIRSDISGFFDAVPRGQVLAKIASQTEDKAFMQLLSKATEVCLKNENALGENRKVFPTNAEGIAQGSPLSPLFGNILLYEFDQKFNTRGIICVRFIDDFVLLSKKPEQVKKAFQSAKAYLAKKNLACHDPFRDNPNTEKSQEGRIQDGFDFLGYNVRPGLIQPSKKSRKNILKKVDEQLSYGRKGITNCLHNEGNFQNRFRYVQTLDMVDKILRGWANSFSYSNSINTLEDLDVKIDSKLSIFRSWYSNSIADQGWKQRRRSGGVCLLSDTHLRKVDDVPFRFENNTKRFRTSKSTITISTDGSVVGAGKRQGKDLGFGGWAFVDHDNPKPIFGNELQATNNQMELTAVLKALQHFKASKSIIVRTDSQYVSRTYNDNQVVKSNTELWKQMGSLTKGKAVKIVWVKAHDGDHFNELADKAAHKAAKDISAKG